MNKRYTSYRWSFFLHPDMVFMCNASAIQEFQSVLRKMAPSRKLPCANYAFFCCARILTKKADALINVQLNEKINCYMLKNWKWRKNPAPHCLYGRLTALHEIEEIVRHFLNRNKSNCLYRYRYSIPDGKKWTDQVSHSRQARQGQWVFRRDVGINRNGGWTQFVMGVIN